jgi:polyhydroxybutyrate depolymerase
MSRLAAACSLTVLVAGCADGLAGGSADLALPSGAGDLAVAGGAADLAPAWTAPDGGFAYSNPAVKVRPYMYKVPAGYDPSRAWPLVVLLHGYTASGATQDAYFRLSSIVDAKGFLYAYPDGTKDRVGNRFWNADDACCDLFGAGPDDVTYIDSVIDDMSTNFHVDPKRVFLVGHSNGAFMSHRLACDSARRIAAIVVLAGDVWKDASRCNPDEPVSVLQIHGDADAVVLYGGGQIVGEKGPYPSAKDCVSTWAAKNGCGGGSTAGAPMDLDTALAGDETTTEAFGGCRPGGAAALWTIKGGSHIPMLVAAWPSTIYDWLAAHPKP